MGKRNGRIALIGLRGSGKSTVGSIIAQRLGLPFHDSDAEVTARHGKSAGEIIRCQGEAEFRRRERDVVVELAALPCGVIALGGGAPCDPRSRENLASWTAILLDAPDSVLQSRVDADTADSIDRPPLTDAGNDRGSEFAILRERRWDDYLALDPVVVDTASLTPEQVADTVLERIGSHR